MFIVRPFLICVFGFLIYVISIADCRNADPNLKDTLSEEDQNKGESCFTKLDISCNPQYYYRQINGGCTNLNVPTRGMAGSAFTRLMPALYKGDSKTIRTQITGKELNSARVLSNIFCTDLKEDDPTNLDKVFTLSMLQWSQLTTHDITATSGKPGPSCCTTTGQRIEHTGENCIGIKVPTNDRFYSQFKKTCINLKRSKTTEDSNCTNLPTVLPINFVTCYIDGSELYGSTEEATSVIRLYEKGLMKYKEINGSIFPPNVEDPQKVCKVLENEELCIQTGDPRANAHPMLAVMHTVLLRLHNIIATKFGELNPKWDDAIIFHETRRFVGAILQHITYKHFVPNLLGKSYMESINCMVKDSGYNNIYDPSINPQMMVEFGCSFRALHSTIVDKVVMYDENRNPVLQWNFSDFYNSVDFITEGNNFEFLIIGMTNDRQGNLDRHFPTSITDKLFQVNGVGADMESIDIEKCRDLGCNTFAKYLTMIGEPYPTSWDDFKKYMPENMVERLKKRYDCFEDVELFIGGILQYDSKDSQLGSVFQAIIAEQFCRSMKGDRFHYELGDQAYPFTEKQLEQIRKVTLAFLYCYSSPKLEKMQPDAFRIVDSNNQLKSCKEIIGDFTLDPWIQK